MQVQRHLNEHEVDEVVRLYAETNNVREVARQLELRRQTVSEILMRRGVDISPFALTDQQVGRAIELYEQDPLTLAAVARRIGSKPNTVRDALLRRDVVLRKRWDYQVATFTARSAD
ncbi:hypothetical protein D1871_19695 [Nakamurella silvestris]|nr:hypothetical protein D1871_19695 [Nakamurella silvestris]